MPVIRRTALAEEDLIDIWIYIAQDNPVAASNLLDEIERKFSTGLVMVRQSDVQWSGERSAGGWGRLFLFRCLSPTISEKYLVALK